MYHRTDRPITVSVSFLVIVVMAVSALTASCSKSNPQPSTSQIASTTPPSSPATPVPKPTAQFSGLKNGSVVSFSQDVAGSVSDLPQGMDIWLVVRPNLAPQFWPQPGPILLDQNGQFYAQAYFGASVAQNRGEKFLLLLVGAASGASQRFKEFVNRQQGMGMSGLPLDAQILTQITVRRS